MTAKELRIGNLILFTENNEPSIVAEIDAKGVKVDVGKELVWIELEAFSPIPLTSDWIKMFGFQDGKIQISNSPKRWLSWSYAKEFCIENSDWDELHEIKNVEYVHQLQNLYFALTGSELPHPTQTPKDK